MSLQCHSSLNITLKKPVWSALNSVNIMISYFHRYVIRLKNWVFIFYAEVSKTLKKVFFEENLGFSDAPLNCALENIEVAYWVKYEKSSKFPSNWLCILESIIYERQVYSNKYDDSVIKNKLFSTWSSDHSSKEIKDY